MRMSQVSLAFAALACLVHGQCSDPFDSVLCVSTITMGQAAQFRPTDGVVAAFWSSLSDDSCVLTPPAYCYPGACSFSDSSDARVLAKAAGDCYGLYLYVEVRDNVWMDWSGGYGHEDDAVVLYLDTLDANTIWTCTDCLLGLYESRLTHTSQEIRVMIGGTSPPDTFRLSYYDPDSLAWKTTRVAWQEAGFPP